MSNWKTLTGWNMVYRPERWNLKQTALKSVPTSEPTSEPMSVLVI